MSTSMEPVIKEPLHNIDRRKTSLSTIIVMVSTGLSRILGFVRAAVMAAFFGGAGTVDIYNLVFMIPNNLRNLLAEGALSSAFIPTLSHSLVHDPSKKDAQKLISTIMAFQLVLLVPFLILCMVFADPIVYFMLSVRGEQHALAVNLFSWIINYILLVSVSAILMGILNSHGKFAIPALAPLMFSITTIISIFLFSSQMDVFSVAIGVISGGILQILVMIPSFRRIGYRFKLNFNFRQNKDFQRVLKLWGPVLGTAAIFSINEQIAVYFASGLGSGSGTAMANALLFFQLPLGLFSSSITTVLFPRMSRQIAENQSSELKETVLYGLKMMCYLLIPSTIVLILLGHEIIAVALQRGKYTSEYTALATQVLFAYCLGLLSGGAARFLQRFFYSYHNFRTPLISALLIVGFDIALTIGFIWAGFGISSLGYANSIATTIGFMWLYLGVRRKLKGLEIIAFLGAILKSLLACIPMVVGIVFFLHLTGEWWRTGSTLTNCLMLLIAILWAIVSVLGMYILLKVEVLDFVMRRKRG